MIKYIIPIAPITKKNSQQILINHKTGKPFIAPSPQYKRYLSDAGYFLIPKPKKPLDGKYNVLCLFYKSTARASDLSNHLEAIDDVLVHYGILADDNCNIICSHDGSRVYVDKKNPRTEIYISDFEE